MKIPKLNVILALWLIAALMAQPAYSQEEPTATDAQKRVVRACRIDSLIQGIGAAAEDDKLQGLIDNAFSEECAYENYEKFAADAKAIIAGEALFNNKDYLYYAIARARYDQLSSLSKNNDIAAGRLYMSVNDKYFIEAIEYLDMVALSTKSNSLAIDSELLKFIIFKEKFQPLRSDEMFDSIASRIARYSDDRKACNTELKDVVEELKKFGFPTHAIKLKILYASKVDPETAKEVIEEIRISADRYFEQNDMKEAANLYEQYIAAAPIYHLKEAMAAKIMEVGEKYFTAGKFKEAKKYYGLYLDKYSDMASAGYCAYKLAVCSYCMKDHIRTIAQLTGFLDNYKSSVWFDKAFEMLSKVYYENLPRDKAIESIRSIIDKYYRKDTGDYAQILMAMLYYRAKNFDSAEDKLKGIDPSSSCYYASRLILDDIKEIRSNKTPPVFGTDATDSYRIWDPYQGIEVKIVPSLASGAVTEVIDSAPSEDGSPRIEVNKLAKIRFTLQTLVDEDKFKEYTIDKDDQSRLPKMIKEETEKDLLLLRWTIDGGSFTDDKEMDARVWQAPAEPGAYKLTVNVDDFGLVRVPNKGLRKDPARDIILNIFVK